MDERSLWTAPFCNQTTNGEIILNIDARLICTNGLWPIHGSVSDVSRLFRICINRRLPPSTKLAAKLVLILLIAMYGPCHRLLHFTKECANNEQCKHWVLATHISPQTINLLPCVRYIKLLCFTPWSSRKTAHACCLPCSLGSLLVSIHRKQYWKGFYSQ